MTGDQRHPKGTSIPRGGFTYIDGSEWYRIDGYDLLDPFLVSMVTPTDQWMYVSSSGALTAGRRSAQEALFPYETDDRLHRAGGRVGPVTVVRVGAEVWEPFSPGTPLGLVERSIAKTSVGDRLRFEESHPGLGLTFRYTWAAADRFGFVRTCELLRHEDLSPAEVVFMDGLADVLPSGVDLWAQTASSTLVDAYRRSELDEESGLAVFTLEALVSDRPEPAESLQASAVWSVGLSDAVVALSDAQVRRFRSGVDLAPEPLVKGRKGGFFLSAPAVVAPGMPLQWIIGADLGCDHGALARLRSWLLTATDRRPEIQEALDAGHSRLVEIVAGADALQQTRDRAVTVHHFANVLFNVMRGGVFLDGHRIAVADVARFMAERNRPAAARFAEMASDCDPVMEVDDLVGAVAGDPDLERLAAEYLPLGFSRRHGDPSRPWNRFEISSSQPDGTLPIGYEGNWRDIFQNWEALLHSYPCFAHSLVAKFLNASTVDGFNPYRITDRGIDWEIPEAGSWGNLGYWGDHQISYLHRLLDAWCRFFPGTIESMLDRVAYSYADVPYRIVPYEEMVADPKRTIVFDDERQQAVEHRVEAIGEDGRLVPGKDGSGVHHASLAEKLLVPVLSKMSNFVAGGGIWMNTQRPEWNDANNALVGHGVSMVTLYYVREYLALLEWLFSQDAPAEVPIGGEVLRWLDDLETVLEVHRSVPEGATVAPADRRSLLDGLGRTFADYRERAYESGPGAPISVPIDRIRSFFGTLRPFLDHTLRAARRGEGLVESYCLLHLEPGVARLEPLYEMLEGQVAALATGGLTNGEAVELLDTMFESTLYRHDQHTFLLYPNRSLPAFREKNVVPEDAVGLWGRRIIETAPAILYRDTEGIIRFAASFRSARDLSVALDGIAWDGDAQRAEAREELLALYERVFHHAAFTGRSGTMYRYEGLGSVYWHMVSKLLLAVQERAIAAAEAGESPEVVAALAARYRHIRSGLGFAKTPAEQGTFPTDPHSHTPAHTGAQQPGMTGQVKEGVLLRWGELGVRVEAGTVRFRPLLLDPAEFLTEVTSWEPLGEGAVLEPGTLGFTYCGVPVVYHLRDEAAWSRVHHADGRISEGSDLLDATDGAALLARRGEITRVDVGVDRTGLLVGSHQDTPGTLR